MPLSDLYRRQAALLVRALPLIATETCFALKGGTAINLFVRDMPRLSVDVDLTYLPREDRIASLKAIDAALKRVAQGIKRGIQGARVTAARLRDEIYANKLIVRADGVQIKIEVTPVLRGLVSGAGRRRQLSEVYLARMAAAVDGSASRSWSLVPDRLGRSCFLTAFGPKRLPLIPTWPDCIPCLKGWLVGED